MRKIVLDTNAFRYLYQVIANEDTPLQIMGKRFDKEKYLEFVSSSEYILLPSESLFELFLQSYWNIQSVNLFCITYQSILNRIGKQHVRIFNSRDLYFDIEKLSKLTIENEMINISDYICPRVCYEYKIMIELCWLIICAVSDMLFELFEDVSIDGINDASQNSIKDSIMRNVKYLYDKYYTKEITNKQFQSELDKLFEELIRERLEIVLLMIKVCNSSIVIPNEIFEIEKTESGATYCKNLVSVLSKKCNKVIEIFNCEVERNIELRKDKLQSISLTYMMEICKLFITGRKIRKNDIIDCSILTIFDYRNEFENQTGSEFDFYDISLITFDKFVYRFSKEHNCGFKKEFYDCFLID